ncbi:hypothetical protein ACHHYP_03664 [Achlya hypogyna]|uniref:Secreted protein n=1 Tax=Achlya hypogyna TaxID=1202772 RepID=A0A1V9Z392_ACHHY|nr:hypothetical protein ACHHYP_03664 [Achlya hypogyna]
MVFTQHHTASYTFKASMVVWITASTLSLVDPVQHSVSIQRTCDVTSMDLQLVCSSGAITIGSVSRLLLLVAIAIGSSVVMYTHDRLRYRVEPPVERPSHLLSCGAKYLFERNGWVHGGVYHVDYALYVFDIKTWRVLVMSQDAVEMATHGIPPTLPLVE